MLTIRSNGSGYLRVHGGIFYENRNRQKGIDIRSDLSDISNNKLLLLHK